MANITVSSSVDSMLKASSASGIRDAIGSINYPYTTDFQGSAEQTRNLTSITSSDGYFFNSSLTSIYVGSNVTSIGSYAFGSCTSLTSITIPDSVTSIGSGAFFYCSSLASITIPDSVTSIGYSAFNGCLSLTSITIPDSVTSIASGAFFSCTSLTSITIPDSVTSIASSAFQNCSSLTSITIPDSVTTIGNNAFNGCTSLATINCLATTAPTLGNNVFFNVAATEIHVPVGSTGYGATYGGLTVIFDL